MDNHCEPCAGLERHFGLTLVKNIEGGNGVFVDTAVSLSGKEFRALEGHAWRALEGNLNHLQGHAP